MLHKWLTRMPLPCAQRRSAGVVVVKPPSTSLPEAAGWLRLGDGGAKAVFLFPRCRSFVAHGLANQADYLGGPDEATWMGAAYFERHRLPAASAAARLLNSSRAYGGGGRYDSMAPEERLGVLWARKLLFARAHLPESGRVLWMRSDQLHEQLDASAGRAGRFFDLRGAPPVDDLLQRQGTVGIKGEWHLQGSSGGQEAHHAVLAEFEARSERGQSLVLRLAAELSSLGEPELMAELVS